MGGNAKKASTPDGRRNSPLPPSRLRERPRSSSATGFVCERKASEKKNGSGTVAKVVGGTTGHEEKGGTVRDGVEGMTDERDPPVLHQRELGEPL